jgi:hypothetical protein
VHSFARLGAALALLGAVAVMAIASAGAQAVYVKIEHCHGWPGATKVHWDTHWLHHLVGADHVANVQFRWRWLGGFLSSADGRIEGDNAVHITPVFASHADAVLTLSDGRTIDMTEKLCTL